MNLALSREDGGPLYRQIAGQIGYQIRSGALHPGDRLPTVRQLAEEHGLTRLTVQTAYAELQTQGLIESRVGRGTFVSASAQVTRSRHSDQHSIPWANRSRLGQLMRQRNGGDTITFARAIPELDTYPLQEIAEAAQRALQHLDVLDYGPIQGDGELLQQLSELLLERGLTVAPEAMFVTAGAQQGVDLAIRGLTDAGDVVLVDEPTYPGVLETAAQQGRRLVGVPRDGSGFDMEALEIVCRTHRPALFYVMPTFGNPTGTSLPPDQCDALLELARTFDFLILEDDTYGFLALDDRAGSPLKSKDTEGRVIYLTTLSKALAPALRLGVIVASVSQLLAIADAKQGSDLVCSMLLQRTAAEYLQSGRFHAHLDHARALYRERRDVMLQALDRHLAGCTWTRPVGGLSLWVTLPAGIDEGDFVRDAADEGVGVAPGRLFMTRECRRAHLRLSFGMHAPERIEEGVATLGLVLQRHLGHGDLTIVGRSIGPLV